MGLLATDPSSKGGRAEAVQSQQAEPSHVVGSDVDSRLVVSGRACASSEARHDGLDVRWSGLSQQRLPGKRRGKRYRSEAVSAGLERSSTSESSVGGGEVNSAAQSRIWLYRRRGRDSNPRYAGYAHNGFRDRP